jgi:hypothetical protein
VMSGRRQCLDEVVQSEVAMVRSVVVSGSGRNLLFRDARSSVSCIISEKTVGGLTYSVGHITEYYWLLKIDPYRHLVAFMIDTLTGLCQRPFPRLS